MSLGENIRSERPAEGPTRAVRPDAALRASQELLPLLVEGANGYALFTIDKSGVIDSWNEGAEAVFGWNEEEIIGESFSVAFTPEDRATDQPRLELEMAARDGSAPDVRWHLRKDGGRVFINGSTTAIFDAHGELSGFLKIGRDVTAQRETEAALRTSEEKYRALFETIDEGFVFGQVVRDGDEMDFRFDAVNPAFERLTGYSGETLIGQTTRSAYPEIDESWYDTLAQVGFGGPSAHLELHSRRLGKWLSVNVSSLGLEGAGEVALAITDITERRSREAATALLADVSQELTRHDDIPPTLNSLAAKIGAHLQISDCFFVELDEARSEVEVLAAWSAAGESYFVGTHALSKALLEQIQRLSQPDLVMVVEDAESDPRFADIGAPRGWRAWLGAQVVNEDGRRFALVCCQSAPRLWSDAEAELARELAARVWTRLERARADEALRRSEEQHRLMVENLRDYALYTLDLEGRVTSWNDGLRRLTGYEAQEILGRHIRLLYPKAAQEAGMPEEEMERARATGRVEDEGLRVRKDGTPFWVNAIVTAVKDGRGNLVGFVKIARDVTQRRLAEREQRRRDRHNALLTERNRMAQELHDTLAQGFTGIKLQIDMAEYALEGPPVDVPVAMHHIVRAREFAQQSQVEARRSISALRSPLLETHSLGEALEKLVEEFDSNSRVSFSTRGRPVELPPLVHDDLYRIGQEALTNALRHSGATRIALSLAFAKNEVHLKVVDDGDGFNPRTCSAGFGITGMTERAQRIGAKLKVTSGPGASGGTMVSLKYPVGKQQRSQSGLESL